MAYIGKNLAGVLKESKTVTTMIGDGSDTTLTLSDSPGSVNNVLLFLDGVRQTPVTNYNVSGTALTFSTAPAAGVNVVAVVGNHSGVDTRNLSVTSQKIVDGMVTDAKIATGISSSKLTGALPALDGSALTGITENATPLFKSTSDPTVTSNKTLGQLWSNSTSGEMYVCVDATTNANVWRNVGDSIGGVQNHLVATGGLITTDGDYKVHTFFSSGTFSPIALGNSATGNQVEYLVVAGGGGGGGCDVNTGVGGGGAGGYRTASNFTVSVESLTVIIGGGGAAGTNNIVYDRTGSDSVFSSITSVGGGGGAQQYSSATVGGSGGGGEGFTGPGDAAGNGVGAAGTAGQGNAGGAGSQSSASYGGGGGGGAGAVGADGGSTFGGAGGVGLASDISETGVNVFRGGGGGGSTANGGTRGAGGNGGGGQGGNASVEDGLPGHAFTGGGGGAGGNIYTGDGALGGSGVVIIRYKFQ